MVKYKRRFVHMLLSTILALAVSLAGWTGFPSAKAEAADGITRAEWLHRLAETFGMAVEEDNYPDNYFRDLEADSEYYYDVLLNVEFGVIDVEAGGEVRSNEAVTREFASHTLNYCMGYQMEDAAYSFSDADACRYPEDAQAAVNRGWLALTEGKFCPNALITAQEAERMLEDAAKVISGDVITEESGSYEFAEDVVVIQNPCTVGVDESGRTVVEIENMQEAAAAGTRFAVYQNNIPVVYIASSVTSSGGITRITAEVDDSGTAYTAVEAQGIVYGSIADIEALDGAKVVFLDEETGVEYESAEAVAAVYGARSPQMFNTDIVVSKKIDFGDGLSADVTLKIKNPKVDFSMSIVKGYARAIFEGDTELSLNGSKELIGEHNIGEIRLVNMVFPGVGGFVVSFDANLSGTASAIEKGHLRMGLDASVRNGVRIIKEFQAKSFTLTAQAEAQIGIEAKLGLTELPILKAYVYAKIGGKAEAKVDIPIEESFSCVNFAAYMYASCGAKGSLTILNVSREINIECTIFDVNNSPLRIYRHYENGVEVAACTAGTEEGGSVSRPKYHTPVNSSWGGSGWSGGTLSAGYNGSNVTIPAFEYQMNQDKDGIVITKYNGNATSLVIPSVIDGYMVTGIGSSVFANRTKLVSVIIPDCVVEIGDSAFSSCTKLSNISLPKNLTSLGHSAFRSCTALTSINLPKSLKECGKSPFAECINLKGIQFEEGVTVIPGNIWSSGIFGACPGLEEIRIPDTVTEIGEGAFGGCINLKQAIIPDSVTEIGDSAFSGCTKLSNISLPKNLTSLGHSAFRSCTALTSINLPKSLKECGKSPFAECINLKGIQFEEGVTVIPGNIWSSGIFGACPGLEEIRIPDTVTEIGEGAFGGCINLKQAIIPDSVTEIGDSAFSGCTKLSNISLPKNLTSLGHSAFRSCTALTSINLPKSLKECGKSPFAECINLKGIQFEEGVTVIPGNIWSSGIFGACPGLEEIRIPDTVTEIGRGAFGNCINLRLTFIPNSVKSIEDNAFFGCAKLESIIIPDSVLSIGGSAFSGCAKLESITIPDNVTKIGSYAFQNCTNLRAVNLSNGITGIPSYAFAGCSSLESITLPFAVTTIYGSAFADCISLKEINWNENISAIESSAFKNCDSLVSIAVPNTVTTLGGSVFADCDSLAKIDLGNNVTAISQSAFEHCDSLTAVKLPYTVTSIGSNAFKDCVKFTDITIPRGTTSIAGNTFSYPDRLTIHGVPGTYAENYAKEKSIRFEENETAASAVSLKETSVTLAKGESRRLIMDVTPADFMDEVTWETSNSKIVSLDKNGLARGRAYGTAVIKVTVGNVSAQCNVTVADSAAPAPTNVPVPVETPKPTDTPAPTGTPKPVETPRPVETPAPTGTPNPTEPPMPTASPAHQQWIKDETGREYWYENGVRQGYRPDDPAYRGKEIYDPESDAWYWLDNVQQGAKAVSKDVYQESGAGLWAEREDGTGKWVRYDGSGHMIKGWDTNENGTYYFDPVYGTMAKGTVTIDGSQYHFDEATGVLTAGPVSGGSGSWMSEGGKQYWYENGVRQGYDPRNASYRGKEIYDPESDAWYWLDNVQQGAKAVSKDVYQESGAGLWAEREDGTGKWVRYDGSGHMIKGWDTNENGTYYFDLTYGTMAKGAVTIDGKDYYFDEESGILMR